MEGEIGDGKKYCKSEGEACACTHIHIYVYILYIPEGYRYIL